MTEAQSDHLKKAFLKDFAQTGNISESCRNVGITRRRTVYEWQEKDDAFAFAYREAEITATEVLEAEARRRAVDGVAREIPIYHNGKLLHTVIETKHSDTLLIFLLKARDPAKYRDRMQLQHADADGEKFPLGAVEAFVAGVLGARDGA